VRSRLGKFRLSLIDQLQRQPRHHTAASPTIRKIAPLAESFALIQLLTRPLRYDRLVRPMQRRTYAASLPKSMGSIIKGSSFSGLFTRLDIGHIRIRPAEKGRISWRGSGSSLSHRV